MTMPPTGLFWSNKRWLQACARGRGGWGPGARAAADGGGDGSPVRCSNSRRADARDGRMDPGSPYQGRSDDQLGRLSRQRLMHASPVTGHYFRAPQADAEEPYVAQAKVFALGTVDFLPKRWPSVRPSRWLAKDWLLPVNWPSLPQFKRQAEVARESGPGLAMRD